MDFSLESWEVPPGAAPGGATNSIEFGPVNWQGVQTQISVRLLRLVSGEALAFFHPHHFGVNFVPLVSSLGLPALLHNRVDKTNLRRWIEWIGKGNHTSHFARTFRVERRLCQGFLNGQIAWMDRDEMVYLPPTVYPRFYAQSCPFEAPFVAWKEPSPRAFAWLRQGVRDADSEVNFAWYWLHQSQAQRDDRLAKEAPRWGELRALMRAVARVVELPAATSWTLQIIEARHHAPELLARLKPWRELLSAHFLPLAPLRATAPANFETSIAISQRTLRRQRPKRHGPRTTRSPTPSARLAAN